jgi:hypothetical protein
MTRMKLRERRFAARLTGRRLVAAVVFALLLAADASAQDKQAPKADGESVPKFEVGGQYSKLRFENSDPSPAAAAFVAYNFTRHLSVEAEAYFFPFKLNQDYVTGGRPFQLQAGIKAGKRFRRFSLFAKARPGFITFGETATPKLGQSFTAFDGRQFFLVDFVTERKTHFSLDLGGVVEYHASRRVFARFDAGDTLIRYGKHKEIVFDFVPDPIFEAPARTHLYPQFSAGVGVRLGSLSDDDGSAATSATKGGGRPSKATRFEAGAQFTSLSFHPIRQLFPDVVIGSEPLTTTQLGFGGRFTYNLTGHFAVEAETNLLPRKLFLAAGASGRVTQGQFGVKAGKRFGSFGVFAKARPGFVSFGSSTKQVGTRPFTFDGRQFTAGLFEVGRRTFFSADVGGVVELYASRRWLLRFDAGDTVIHYGRRSISSFFVNPAILVAPPETHHNFQFSSGAAFRF